MGLIIVTPMAASSGGITNMETLNKISTDANGNLVFNGKTIPENYVEAVFNATLTAQHTSQKYIEMPENCDTSRAITVNIQGISVVKDSDFEIIERNNRVLISWNELGLESIARTGDKIQITYYKEG